MAYVVPANAYPTSPFEKFVTGAFEGYDDSFSLAKKANELKIQMKLFEAAEATEEARKKAAADKASTSQGVKGEPGQPLPDTGTGETGRAGGAGGGYLAGTTGGGINPDQAHAYLANNLAATPQETALLLGSISGESSFRPDILHDGGKGYGLFGHNSTRLAAMRQFAGVGPNDPVPWQKQLAFGLQELRSRPEGQLVNQANTAEDITKLGFRFERPAGWQVPTAHDSWGLRLAATSRYYGGAAPSTAEKVPEAGDMPQLPQVTAATQMAAPIAGLPAGIVPTVAPQTAALGPLATQMGAPIAGLPALAPPAAAPAVATAPAAPKPSAALVAPYGGGLREFHADPRAIDPATGLENNRPGAIWHQSPKVGERSPDGSLVYNGTTFVPVGAAAGAPPKPLAALGYPQQQALALIPVNSGLWG